MQWTQDQHGRSACLPRSAKPSPSRRTGIPAGTIAVGSRSHRAPSAALREVNAARLATIAQRKAKLAEELLGDIERMRKRCGNPPSSARR